MSGSQKSSITSSLDFKSTSQDEFIYNLGYDPIVAEQNRAKVNTALRELNTSQNDYIDVSLSESNILARFVDFLKPKNKKTIRNQNIIQQISLSEANSKALEQSMIQQRHQIKKTAPRKRVKKKSFFNDHFCDSWD